VEPDRPLLLLLPNVAAWDDAIRQAARVGLERSVVGYLHGGLDAWIAAGQPVEMGDTITVTELGARLGSGDGLSPFVIDVRQGSEYERGHVPGSVHIGAGELADRLSELPRDRPLATICASGYRASVAASLLRRAGFTNVSSVAAGVPAWHRAGGRVQRGRMPGELTTERP
jgi:hydroxyacylglutathione hydrolase